LVVVRGLTCRVHAGEGFNWGDQMRSRHERSASMSANSQTAAAARAEARPPPVAPPASPAQVCAPKQRKAPDPFQERILKGDFYMD